MNKRKPIFESGMVVERKAHLQHMASGMEKAGMEMEIIPMLKRGGVYRYKIYRKRRR